MERMNNNMIRSHFYEVRRFDRLVYIREFWGEKRAAFIGLSP